ncbi:hypothetical protein PsorP6_017007 [Peronosclerospora sorghi]|uniref:Uncharacterized protein n=1 Tax=Peronosclerospora sorghi TaxID=230839 RepID=A0ACC0WCN9_9STRA|nr:hypothetical protein PsorP6_017007 [Peronosclerospora sorghi]
MQIPIVVDMAASEWSLLEFQGDLITSTGVNLSDLQGVDVGTLRFGEDGDLTLRIGNHILLGKVTKLPQPFAILQKQDPDDNDRSSTSTAYEIVGVARTRVIFASRPKPVLA